VVVDTGGISGEGSGVELLMEQQVQAAIDEADHILFMLDGRAGRIGGDEEIAAQLRRTGKPITLVINKSENLDQRLARAEFYAFGLGEPVPIAAVHGRGVSALIDGVLSSLPDIEEREDSPDGGIQVAVVGRPNVGKSTLVNRLLGEERVVTFDQPGTTRDSVFISFTHDEKPYTLIDTAGVRRRARVSDVIEKFSVIKTLQAIEQANVILLVLDARLGVSEQDATLAGHILESGRALVIVVNKWDGLDQEQRDKIREELDRKLPFLDFAPRKLISALHGSGVGDLYSLIDRAYASATRNLPTPELTRVLEAAVLQHQPPMVRGRRIKLRYAHQGGQNPPIIVIHGNQADAVPSPYKRYLVKRFRQVFSLHGTPVRLEFRSGDNPFKGRKNKLTRRQINKRQRLKKFVNKSKR
jgi:GTP-binding protein